MYKRQPLAPEIRGTTVPFGASNPRATPAGIAFVRPRTDTVTFPTEPRPVRPVMEIGKLWKVPAAKLMGAGFVSVSYTHLVAADLLSWMVKLWLAVSWVAEPGTDWLTVTVIVAVSGELGAPTGMISMVPVPEEDGPVITILFPLFGTGFGLDEEVETAVTVKVALGSTVLAV